jgi:hypothetical protein
MLQPWPPQFSCIFLSPRCLSSEMIAQISLCINIDDPPHPHEAAKDAADQQAILQALEDQLKQGAKDLGGNRGLSSVSEGGAERGAP